MKRSSSQKGSLAKIVVMGATGTGKSTFIKLLTNDDNILVGHKQQSETFGAQAAEYFDQATGRSVMLVDTPGFDDSREGVTDTDILEKIVQFLEPVDGEAVKLNGVIFMHRISDPRVGGASRKNLRLFRSLCGDKNLGNVRIVTTNWSRVSEEEGDRREADLEANAFKALLDCGAQMRRHANTVESARKVLSELILLPTMTMQIQKELREGKKLSETAAGKVVLEEMAEAQKKHERELVDLKKEMELAVGANDRALRLELEGERKVLEDRMVRAKADRSRLEIALPVVGCERRRSEKSGWTHRERASNSNVAWAPSVQTPLPGRDARRFSEDPMATEPLSTTRMPLVAEGRQAVDTTGENAALEVLTQEYKRTRETRSRQMEESRRAQENQEALADILQSQSQLLRLKMAEVEALEKAAEERDRFVCRIC